MDASRACVVLFPSIHHVIRAEKLFRRADIQVEVVPVPKAVNPNCGMALQFGCRERERVEALITRHKLPLTEMYTLVDGKYHQWKKYP